MQWAHTVGSQGTPPVSAAALPQAPGVYRFRDRAGRVLYIGRAVSLRRRELADLEGQAGEKSQSMLLAQMLLAAAFLVFLMYPAVHLLLQA